jgi:hypothetical protein
VQQHLPIAARNRQFLLRSCFAREVKLQAGSPRWPEQVAAVSGAWFSLEKWHLFTDENFCQFPNDTPYEHDRNS